MTEPSGDSTSTAAAWPPAAVTRRCSRRIPQRTSRVEPCPMLSFLPFNRFQGGGRRCADVAVTLPGCFLQGGDGGPRRWAQFPQGVNGRDTDVLGPVPQRFEEGGHGSARRGRKLP